MKKILLLTIIISSIYANNLEQKCWDGKKWINFVWLYPHFYVKLGINAITQDGIRVSAQKAFHTYNNKTKEIYLCYDKKHM